MPSFTKVLALTAIALSSFTLAHPGHDIQEEIEARKAFIREESTNLQVKCGAALKAQGIERRAKERRQALAEDMRKRRGLDNTGEYLNKRSFAEVLAKDHHSSLTGVTLNTPQDYFFSDNSSCVLQPETTEGPYYVSGEYVRKDIRDNQAGVELVVDMQVINVNTCQPIPNLYVEFWHCNSTGVYGGVVAGSNGNQADKSNINNTMLRGIQPTDSEGVVQVITIFPGHYTGRTSHIHILSHNGGTLLPNNTFAGSAVSHVGQLFFDQSLITQVEKVSPYVNNKQTLTTNAKDGIMAAESATSDPVVEYVLVGGSVSDGIVSWITVGVNPNVSKTVKAAAHYGSNGGS